MALSKLNKKKECKDVAVIIPYCKDRILLQLRDEKARIFPNCWGFFGGSLEEGESPAEAAKREFIEELSCRQRLSFLSKIFYRKLKMNLYVYYPILNDKIKIKLNEGKDKIWVNLDEIKKGRLYSKKYKEFYELSFKKEIYQIAKLLFDEITKKDKLDILSCESRNE